MTRGLVVALGVLLAGCAPGNSAPVRSYDLGVQPPRATLPALRAVSVRATMPFDGVDMLYRLAWREAADAIGCLTRVARQAERLAFAGNRHSDGRLGVGEVADAHSDSACDGRRKPTCVEA